MPLTKAAIKRISNKAGAKRVSASLYSEVQSMYRKVLESILTASLRVTENSRRKTVSLGDVKQALTIMRLGIHINPQQKKFDFPVATFKRDIKDILLTPEQMGGNPRFSKEAVIALMSFVGDYLFKYIRSAVGLKGHCGAVTVDQRDLKNVHTVCVDFPKELHKPEGIPDVKVTAKKKKKKKAKPKLTRTGTEIME